MTNCEALSQYWSTQVHKSANTNANPGSPMKCLQATPARATEAGANNHVKWSTIENLDVLSSWPCTNNAPVDKLLCQRRDKRNHGDPCCKMRHTLRLA